MPARLVEITSGELTLAGVLHTPEGDGPFSAVVVCHPHPRMGGDMTSNVVLAAVEGLAAQGIAALRFNFRGSGASEGTHDDGKGERDDVRAALSFAADLGELDATRIGLAGYSFGAGMSAAGSALGRARAVRGGWPARLRASKKTALSVRMVGSAPSRTASTMDRGGFALRS